MSVYIIFPDGTHYQKDSEINKLGILKITICCWYAVVILKFVLSFHYHVFAFASGPDFCRGK